MAYNSNISDDHAKFFLENARFDIIKGFKLEEDKKEDKDKEKVEENKEVKETEDDLTCPLCKSHLTEALSDEVILEHTSQILKVLEDVSENLDEQEDSEDESEDDEDLDEEDLDDEDLDEDDVEEDEDETDEEEE